MISRDGHDRLPLKRLPRRRFATATRFPTGSSGTSRTFFRTWTRGSARTTSSTRRSRRTRRCRARSRRRDGDRLLAALQDLATRSVSSHTRSGISSALKYDEDQRDNEMNARRQQVQILFAKFAQASAWFSPELLSIPLPTVQEWMAKNPELAVYRFAIEDLYRQQEHVLDDKGEHLLSLVEPLFVGAERRLRGAVDRRRQAPDGPPVERDGGDAHLRAVPRDSGDQSQPGGSRRGVHRVSTSCSRPTSTPTRRSTTACCSATGSTRRHAAIERRSTRRSTATTFRRPSSRT